MTEEKKEWYTAPEAAAYLRIPTHRLARLRRLGRVKGIEGGGEHTRYAMYHISWLEGVDTSDMRKQRTKKKNEHGDSTKGSSVQSPTKSSSRLVARAS